MYLFLRSKTGLAMSHWFKPGLRDVIWVNVAGMVESLTVLGAVS